MVKTLRIYRTKWGREPFKKWIGSLKDKVAKTHIKRRLDRLMLGHYGDCKQVTQEIYELRVHQSAGYRIYFAELEQVIILLLLGGSKRTQSKDIKKAKAYLADFWERYHGKTKT